MRIFSRAFGLFVRRTRERGLQSSLRSVGRRVRHEGEYLRSVVFDKRHGIETRAEVKGAEHAKMVAGLSDRVSVDYEPTMIGHFRRMVRRTDVDPIRTAFIDLGCGKGRTLILASQLGFKTVIGVELAAEIADVASKNALHFSRTRRGAESSSIVVLNDDATAMAYPLDPLVVLIFNAFGAIVLGRVLDALETTHKSEPRRITVLYNYPVQRHVFEGRPAWSLRHIDTRVAIYEFGEN